MKCIDQFVKKFTFVSYYYADRNLKEKSVLYSKFDFFTAQYSFWRMQLKLYKEKYIKVACILNYLKCT